MLLSCAANICPPIRLEIAARVRLFRLLRSSSSSTIMAKSSLRASNVNPNRDLLCLRVRMSLLMIVMIYYRDDIDDCKLLTCLLTPSCRVVLCRCRVVLCCVVLGDVCRCSLWV